VFAYAANGGAQAQPAAQNIQRRTAADTQTKPETSGAAISNAKPTRKDQATAEGSSGRAAINWRV